MRARFFTVVGILVIAILTFSTRSKRQSDLATLADINNIGVTSTVSIPKDEHKGEGENAATTLRQKDDSKENRISGQDTEVMQERISVFTEQTRIYEKARSSLIGQRQSAEGEEVCFFVEKASDEEAERVEQLAENIKQSIPTGTVLHRRVAEDLEKQKKLIIKANSCSRVLRAIIPSDPSKTIYVQATQVPDRSLIKFNADGTFTLPPAKLAAGSVGMLTTETFNSRFGHLMKLEVDGASTSIQK